MGAVKGLNIKVFSDGADIAEMVRAHDERSVDGFTTNPTLMRKSGITDYQGFARQVLNKITDMPISFEVFSDEIPAMESEARKIASWGSNVYVKIPVTNTKGESTAELVSTLSRDGIKLNVTALLTIAQVGTVGRALDKNTPSIVSVFAGRIADTGVDPMPIMHDSGLLLEMLAPNAELLWASSRELLNLFQAQQVGCDIVTVTPDILRKTKMIGMDHTELSLDTVKMFFNDARAAGFNI